MDLNRWTTAWISLAGSLAARIALAAALAVSTPVLFAEDAPPAAAAANPNVVSVLQPFVDRNVLAGAVTLIADKDKVLSTDTVGFSDIAAKAPMKPDAVFWIASMTKPITGTALMILVDEGKVNLDDPVEKYLPEFKALMVIAEKDAEKTVLKKPAHPITVREIMSHTSGMEFLAPAESPTLDILPLAQAVKSYTYLPLLSEPGTKYKYSNIGINTGGRIIEVVSQMPYEEFLRTRLFEPLGMKETTFWPNEAQTARIAKTYKPNAAKNGLDETATKYLRRPYSDKSRTPIPGGGLFSTATDLSLFCRMLLNGGQLDGKRILSEAAIQAMTKRSTPETLKDSYGIGWSVGSGTYGHGGALSTNMTIDVKRGLAMIYLVQHEGFPGDGGKAHGAFMRAAETRAVKQP